MAKMEKADTDGELVQKDEVKTAEQQGLGPDQIGSVSQGSWDLVQMRRREAQGKLTEGWGLSRDSDKIVTYKSQQ